jgi:hypothetical protein
MKLSAEAKKNILAIGFLVLSVAVLAIIVIGAIVMGTAHHSNPLP